MMTIREMMLVDYEAMYELWLACEGVGLGASDSREQIGLFLARNRGTRFVAEANGQLIEIGGLSDFNLLISSLGNE